MIVLCYRIMISARGTGVQWKQGLRSARCLDSYGCCKDESLLVTRIATLVRPEHANWTACHWFWNIWNILNILFSATAAASEIARAIHARTSGMSWEDRKKTQLSRTDMRTRISWVVLFLSSCQAYHAIGHRPRPGGHVSLMSWILDSRQVMTSAVHFAWVHFIVSNSVCWHSYYLPEGPTISIDIPIPCAGLFGHGDQKTQTEPHSFMTSNCDRSSLSIWTPSWMHKFPGTPLTRLDMLEASWTLAMKETYDNHDTPACIMAAVGDPRSLGEAGGKKRRHVS